MENASENNFSLALIHFYWKENENMDKQEIYQYLTEQGVHYEVTEHKAVFNMEDVEALDMPYPNLSAKNLFVCDRKKNYYLITTKGNKLSLIHI